MEVLETGGSIASPGRRRLAVSRPSPLMSVWVQRGRGPPVLNLDCCRCGLPSAAAEGVAFVGSLPDL